MEINQEELDILVKIVLNNESVNCIALSTESRKILRGLIKKGVVEFALPHNREEPIIIPDKETRELVYETVEDAPHNVNQRRRKQLYPRKPISVCLFDAAKRIAPHAFAFLLGFSLGLILHFVFAL